MYPILNVGSNSSTSLPDVRWLFLHFRNSLIRSLYIEYFRNFKSSKAYWLFAKSCRVRIKVRSLLGEIWKVSDEEKCAYYIDCAAGIKWVTKAFSPLRTNSLFLETNAHERLLPMQFLRNLLPGKRQLFFILDRMFAR